MADLKLRNLYKMYDQGGRKKKKEGKPNQTYAVNDLTLEIEDGTFLGILGPSGCGKSTTLRMIAGLETITKGEIAIGENVINDTHPKDRGIGLAFEDYALYPPLSVYDNIAFCLRAKGAPKESIDKEVREIAQIMKVENLLEEKVGSLSGGQKQRVNIARALVRKPKILLLDEPLSHLDGKMRQILRGEIKRLHNEIKCTTILVTHDQMEALSLADHIAIMKLGVLQQFGTPDDIYNNPANIFVADFIGEPPMNLLPVTVKKGKGEKLAFMFEDGTKINAPAKFYPVIEDGQQFIMGIRPTSIHLTKDEDWDGEFTVDVFENLGDERIISISIGESFLTIVMEEMLVFEKGDKITVKMEENLLYLFDKETGERIRENNREE